jgi:ADP-ribosylglycohydrolase
MTVLDALETYIQTGNPYSGSTSSSSAGNGCLMRLAPIPLYFAANPEEAVIMSYGSSKTTHGALTCLDACRYFGGLIVGALNEAKKEVLLSERYTPVEGLWTRLPLCPEIDEIARGSFKIKDPPEIIGNGYVVNCLEAALWAFHRSSCFEEGCLMAVNLGYDADTTGAIYGQIAGAYYGVDDIPKSWLDKLSQRELITNYATMLYDYSQ